MDNNMDDIMAALMEQLQGNHELDTDWFKDPSRIHFLGMMVPPRPGFNLFSSLLEYKFFTPSTTSNELFILTVYKWGGDKDMPMMWSIISVPSEFKSQAESIAKLTGMRIADGVPTIMGGDKKMKQMPLNFPNVFTIKNGPQSDVYKGDILLQLQEENKLLEILYSGGLDRVEKELAKNVK